MKNKSVKKYLFLPNLNNIKNNPAVLFVGFVFITLLLLSSVSIVSQNSSFNAEANNQPESARLITNFFYNPVNDGNLEVAPITE